VSLFQRMSSFRRVKILKVCCSNLVYYFLFICLFVYLFIYLFICLFIYLLFILIIIIFFMFQTKSPVAVSTRIRSSCTARAAWADHQLPRYSLSADTSFSGRTFFYGCVCVCVCVDCMCVCVFFFLFVCFGLFFSLYFLIYAKKSVLRAFDVNTTQ
jgi:hypothetical protein